MVSLPGVQHNRSCLAGGKQDAFRPFYTRAWIAILLRVFLLSR